MCCQEGKNTNEENVLYPRHEALVAEWTKVLDVVGSSPTEGGIFPF